MYIKTCVSSILCNEVLWLHCIILLIIDLNNIHGFNTLKYILWILSKKTNVSSWHILPCLSPWLFHVHLFFKFAIQKCWCNMWMINFPSKWEVGIELTIFIIIHLDINENMCRFSMPNICSRPWITNMGFIVDLRN
jgi:hypothetical protein